MAEAEFMRAFHARPTTMPVFDFVLAEKLGQPLDVVREMPHADYVEWAAYYKVKTVLQNMHAAHQAKKRPGS